MVETSIPVNLNAATTYIVRRESSFDNIAQRLHTDPQLLESWNGYKKDLLTKGTTIRVFSESAVPDVRYFVTQENMDEFIRQVEKYSESSKVLRN